MKIAKNETTFLRPWETSVATTYKEAGVDRDAGDALVDWLSESKSESGRNKTPHEDKIVSGIGGFAALFRANFQHMKSPCLVSSTDGVGTKVKLAADFGRFENLGQDLVAMCVNDLACVGAEPLFFLDYYACGKLDLIAAKQFLTGVRRACHESGCALIGGETAEMPGLYHGKDIDCAGFAVGVVDEAEVLGAKNVKIGDRIIGVSSSGFHSNGYSLLRKVFADDINDWIDVLLRPTHLYSQLVREAKLAKGLHAVAHVTGGGLDNLTRVIPDGTSLDLKTWDVPKMFHEVRQRAKLDWPEMLRTLNCGVGLALYVDSQSFDAISNVVKKMNFEVYDLGRVVASQKSGEDKSWSLDVTKI
jgi:phosphoribosylformylglycinamidine cyclo-ligase